MAVNNTEQLRKAAEAILRWDHIQMGEWVEAIEWSESKPLPPGPMLIFPVLFERSWGYERLFPVDVTEDTPEVHAYIKEFYRRNCTTAPSVADAAFLCMKMEHDLKSEWLAQGVSVPCDELSLSNAIHKRASDLLCYKTDVVSTFPYAAICIAKEAELIIARLRRGSSIRWYTDEDSLSRDIRRHALDLMTNEGASGSASPSATDMMVLSALTGIAKEAELICDEVRKENSSRLVVNRSRGIRMFALDVMKHQLDEYVVAANAAAEISNGEHAVWKRNFIATIEQGDPTWTKPHSKESSSDDEVDLISKWRISGSHKREGQPAEFLWSFK
ncbi:unnamed protein product [Urochloa humidicola]